MKKAKKYIKRNIPVEAMQYTGENREELIGFTDGRIFFIEKNGKKRLVLHLFGQEITVASGYYLVKGAGDMIYPMPQDMFEEIYVEVEND